MVEGWARDGLTDAQIAKNIGIATATFYVWKKSKIEFSEALKKGKQVVNVELENALYKKALGASTKTTTYKMIKIDEKVLKARRMHFVKKYQEDHPDADRQETALAAIEQVPVYERVAMTEVENKLAPDTGALMFLLKNRLPEKYREKSYQELNKAQAEKAKAEAEIAKKRVELINQMDDENASNEQLDAILDKLAREVIEDDGGESTDQETNSSS